MDAGFESRLRGVLLGTALGDALGLPAEGMDARVIARRFGRIDRFRLLGHTGFVSDDTEQSALVAESLLLHSEDPEACARQLAKALCGWFWRLPWGVGLATLRSCLRITFGLSITGVASAGNGAAMRAAVLGVFFRDDSERRAVFGERLARVTHLDPRAVAGALFVAEVAGRASSVVSGVARADLCRLDGGLLAEAVTTAIELAERGAPTAEAVKQLGNSGYVLHTVPFAVFCFVRYGDDVMQALTEAIGAGGDTDSIAAILGAWLGALHGEEGLPADMLARIHDGPFGPTHLRKLGTSLAGTNEVPHYSRAAAMLRNLVLYPVIIAHGFRRLLP
jgi:ADP-ribosyl-[dinitrogen reductase] hydrolase